MKRFLMALSFVCIPGYTQADEIKDYIQYQQIRLRTYADAVGHHAETKGQVIVWVGIPDDDQAFEDWKAQKDKAYHVFVDTLPGFEPGTIITAGDYEGRFCQLQVQGIRNELPNKLSKASGRRTAISGFK